MINLSIDIFNFNNFSDMELLISCYEKIDNELYT